MREFKNIMTRKEFLLLGKSLMFFILGGRFLAGVERSFGKTHHPQLPDLIGYLLYDNNPNLYVIEEIKRSSPNTPVIVFTGKEYKSVREYVSLLGACALIEKSSSNDTFISCVKNSLKKSA